MICAFVPKWKGDFVPGTIYHRVNVVEVSIVAKYDSAISSELLDSWLPFYSWWRLIALPPRPRPPGHVYGRLRNGYQVGTTIMTRCRISDYDDSLGSIDQRRAVEFGVRDPARVFFNIVF
jgi:hypothetical protein